MYKLCKVYENRARGTPLRGVYIAHFDQISVKISVLGSCTLTVAPMGVKFGMEEGTLWQISPPSVQRVALHFDKPQNRPLIKLNTGALRFAQCCRYPVDA